MAVLDLKVVITNYPADEEELLKITKRMKRLDSESTPFKRTLYIERGFSRNTF
jgi:hypothetical protein